jgi:hypothetical protein
VYFALISGDARMGQTGHNTFILKASGDIDRTPVELQLDASKPGQLFDGLGGNFRIQNPPVDSVVIAYNLANLPVRWGRVDMPWRWWHADENLDPIAEVKAGRLNPRVDMAMGMARTLAQHGMPVIISAWFPPDWAILGERINWRNRKPGDPFGNALDPRKAEKIYESLTAYLLYLKNEYGCEAVMFSFNESDLGIDVRQTAEEHRQLIRGLGTFMASKGLATKMLLGDTSDAWPIDFIKPTMADPEALKYVGAVSFHSWRGCTDEILGQWHEAARELNVPLLVGEGSTDASAWRNSDIFWEPSFALHEINLYTRICAVAQPKSILQWQLTSDYSILAGGGVYRKNDEPLHPTQRFWNLKQLASTPLGSFHLPISCKNESINSVAYGNLAKGIYTVHIVNNDAGRMATLTGLPPDVKMLRGYVTDSVRGMESMQPIPVIEGSAQFELEAASFTTLVGQ